MASNGTNCLRPVTISARADVPSDPSRSCRYYQVPECVLSWPDRGRADETPPPFRSGCCRCNHCRNSLDFF